MIKINLGNHRYFSSKINELSVVTRIENDELAAAKKNMVDIITMYDKSVYVNTFTYKGYTDWWDKSTRISLKMQLGEAVPVNTSGEGLLYLWIGGEQFSLTAMEAHKLLRELELYAYRTFDTTRKLLRVVDRAANVDELMNIDIGNEYPNPLVID